MEKCTECGGTMRLVCEDLVDEDWQVGRVVVKSAAFLRCECCKDVLLPFDTARALDAAKAEKLADCLASFPIRDFVSAAEAQHMLGFKTRQAFYQNPRIKRGFIYSVPAGPRSRERLYLRRSVELYRDSQDTRRDGRFPLVPTAVVPPVHADALSDGSAATAEWCGASVPGPAVRRGGDMMALAESPSQWADEPNPRLVIVASGAGSEW